MITNLHDAACLADEIASANGFDPPTWDNFPAKLMMVVTEIDEFVDAAEGVENGDCGGTKEELADVAIRLLAMIHALTHGKWNCRVRRYNEPADYYDRRIGWLRSPKDEVWPIVSRISKATEVWRKGRRVDAIQHIEFAIKECFALADRVGFNLFSEILTKAAKNAQRPKLHGKIESVG